MKHSEALQLLHGGRNPFTEFPAGTSWGLQSPNWGGQHPWLTAAIEKGKPGVVIEVGSFLGDSAITMAKAMDKVGGDGVIISIDTFLGGYDIITHPEAKQLLGWHLGRSSLYYNFLANVIKAGMGHRIVPVALDSLNAARLLATLEVKAGVIYIDGSHEEGDVLRDLEGYYHLLEPGGTMIVDDVHIKTVADDVHKFAKKHKLKVEEDKQKFRFHKPEGKSKE